MTGTDFQTIVRENDYYTIQISARSTKFKSSSSKALFKDDT
jgi:hypothetical protein